MTASTRRDVAAAERQEAVVALIELRNFTRMSELLDPAKALELASIFFTLAARSVEEHEGEPFAIQNDTLLAAFRTGPATQFAQNAMNAAQKIQREFGALAEAWQSEYGLQTAVSQGLHLGQTVFGFAGPEGDPRFVALGDTVSIAERLAHRARAGEIVFSEKLAELLEAGGFAVEAEALPALQLVRRPEVAIYGVLLDSRLDFT